MVRNDRFLYVLYGTVVLLELVLVFYTYYFDPAQYIRMVSEDQWAEYSTSLCFLFGAVVAGTIAWRSEPLRRRLAFGAIAMGSLFIAGEEISWGQRLFDLSVPEPILQHNQQNELTIHNLEVVRGLNAQYALAYLIVAWAAVSIAVERSSRIARAVDRSGFPAFPNPLIPLFLLYPAFYAVHELPGWIEFFRKDEITEWFLGMAVVFWAIDHVVVRNRDGNWQPARLLGAILGVPALILALSIGLSRSFPTDDFKYQLQRGSAKAYPKRGLHPQAEGIYAYIYAHPEMVTGSTRINHAELLLEIEKTDEAMAVLAKALDEIGDDDEPRSATLRRKGTIYRLMQDPARAGVEFDRAIEVDREALETAGTDEERSEILISIARTFEARGDADRALETARQAEALVPSALLRVKIDRGHGF